MKTILTKLTTIAALGIFSLLSAETLYIFQTTTLTANDAKKGQIFTGVPVELVKTIDKKAEITLKGFVFDDATKVYSSATKELVIATLDTGFKLTKKANNEVELSGTVEREFLIKDNLEAWEEHEEFYYDMCTQCHAGPKVSHHSMMEWSAIFETMSGFAKLDAEESEYLLRFLMSNASDGLVEVKH